MLDAIKAKEQSPREPFPHNERRAVHQGRNRNEGLDRWRAGAENMPAIYTGHDPLCISFSNRLDRGPSSSGLIEARSRLRAHPGDERAVLPAAIHIMNKE